MRHRAETRRPDTDEGIEAARSKWEGPTVGSAGTSFRCDPPLPPDNFRTITGTKGENDA